MATVLTEKYEINKPSSLTQSIYCDIDKKTGNYSIQSLEPIQLDLINSMYYLIHKQVNTNQDIRNMILNSDKGGSTEFEIELADIAGMLPKYNNRQYEQLIKKIRSLQAVHIVINALNKDKDMETTTTSIITEVTTNVNKTKKITAAFPNKLIRSYNNTQKYFKKHYLSIQFSLKSKYSKLLYELTKDYEGLENGISIPFESLIELLNVTTPNMQTLSQFKYHIIEKSIKEINETTDIEVSYTVVKKSKNDIFFKFVSNKQGMDRLESLGLLAPSIESHRFYATSREKLDKMIDNGYKVHDIESWITADLKKFGNEYEMQEKIDNWIKDTSRDDINEVYQSLAAFLKSDDIAVVIKDYRLVDLYGTKTHTSSPTETVKLLNKFLSSFIEE